MLKLAFAVLAGAALGVGATQMLHAQAKPPAFLISDITVTDPDKFKAWGERVNATFVTHGAKYLARNVEVLAPNGRIAVIGMQGGTKAELDLGALMAKRGSVTATTLRARPVQEKAKIVRGVRDQVWPLVDAGAIAPIIDTTLPMAEAAQAHRLMEASDHLGKILLLP